MKQGTSCNVAIERAEKIKRAILLYLTNGDYAYKNRNQVCNEITEQNQLRVDKQVFSNHMHHLGLSFKTLRQVQRRKHVKQIEEYIAVCFNNDGELSLKAIFRRLEQHGFQNIDIHQNVKFAYIAEKKRYLERNAQSPVNEGQRS